MGLFVCALASGSNGNCYYIGNEQDAVLVDVGISARELDKRMKRQGLSMERVKAIFISHEHTDHISGLASVMKKHRMPVHISASTLIHSGLSPQRERFFNIASEPVRIGSLMVTPFIKVHDAADPYSFVVSCAGINVGVITDIGYACQRVRQHFGQCHAVFLESNYDDDMLMKGGYPWPLKRRISGGKGHISNRQALELFLNYRSEHLSHLFLSHLSKNNNRPQIVEELFQPHGGETNIIITSRAKETEVYHVEASAAIEVTRMVEEVRQLVLW